MNTAKIAWRDSIWFLDVDDTIIDTQGATKAASNGVFDIFAAHYSEGVAQKVQRRFVGLFTTLMAGYRVQTKEDWVTVPGGEEYFEMLLNAIYACQNQVVNQFGTIKKWSREVLLKIACDLEGVAVKPKLIQQAAAAYWDTLSREVHVFGDARDLFQQIKSHARPIFLLTSSDAILQMQNDGQFTYNPSHSEAVKRRRIEALRERGLDFEAITIGDPEDKPGVDYFKKGIRAAETVLGFSLDPKNCIMVGDSFAGDLQTPKEKLGFGLVVLRDKNAAETQVLDAHQIVTANLREVGQYLL